MRHEFQNLECAIVSIVTVQETYVSMSLIYGVCCVVLYFCKEPFCVKAPGNISQRLCSVELQDP